MLKFLSRAVGVATAVLAYGLVLHFFGIAPIVWLCTIVGFVASAYFILTWGWGILRASKEVRSGVTLLGVIDFAGLQALVLLYTGLALVDIVQHGVPDAPDWNALVRRTVLYVLIASVAVLRAARWVEEQREDGVPVALHPVRDASSDHHDALEGRTHDTPHA